MFSLIMISIHCHLVLLFGPVVAQSAMVGMTGRRHLTISEWSGSNGKESLDIFSMMHIHCDLCYSMGSTSQ